MTYVSTCMYLDVLVLPFSRTYCYFYQGSPDSSINAAMNEESRYNKNVKVSFQNFKLALHLYTDREPSLGLGIENEWLASFDISQKDPSGDKGAATADNEGNQEI